MNEELKNRIEQEAQKRAVGFTNARHALIAKIEYALGAETYATRAIAAEEALSEAETLLNEVFQKHESGMLPDRFVYEKIKSFLYPEINKTNGTE